MAARKAPSRKQRWVVKAGSNMVCSGGPILLRAWMQQVAQLRRRKDIEIIWVTSGAIASAVDRTQFNKKDRKLSEKQALSAIGQPLVMDLYNLSLQNVGLLGAQVLLTYDDLSHRQRRENFRNTLNQLLDWGVTPILNENDAVATEEIRFGDNDSLSARVAATMGADRLVILTDVDGLYDADPRTRPEARLISRLYGIPRALMEQTGKSAGSSRGTGGMYSKLAAAKHALAHRIETWLVRGDHPSVLLEVAEDRPVGTRIEPARSRKK